jgi:hypothetical protein
LPKVFEFSLNRRFFTRWEKMSLFGAANERPVSGILVDKSNNNLTLDCLLRKISGCLVATRMAVIHGLFSTINSGRSISGSCRDCYRRLWIAIRSNGQRRILGCTWRLGSRACQCTKEV